MGILAALDNQITMRAESEGNQNSGLLHDFWYGDVGESSDSGIRITEKGSLNISTVWKCVVWRAKMFGSLPMELFERKTLFGRPSSVAAKDHPLYSLVHSAPNPTMTAMRFKGLISADVHLWGNFWAFIQRSPMGEPVGLWRIRPDYVRPCVTKDAGGRNQFWWEVMGDDGQWKKFYRDEILHIPNIIGDGTVGYSAIKTQMNLLGWTRATARYGAQFFKNASRPSGIVSVPQPFKDQKVRDGVISNLTMSGKEAGKLVLIEGAVTYHKLTMDQDEAQFLLTWNAQEDDIAGVMEVKPHEIGIMRHSTNNNIEQETISSVTRNIAPFSINVEQCFDLQLLTADERSRYFHQAELKVLLRGDTAAQTAHLMAMFDRGIYDGNDCSQYLGNAPFEGGDIRFINRAYGPVDQARQWSQVSQNNPTGQKAEAVVREEKEPEDSSGAVALLAFKNGFRDAVGRLMSRKKDRAAAAVAIFGPLLRDVAGLLQRQMSEEFESRYLASLGVRSQAWQWQDAKGPECEEVSADELKRAIEALQP